MKPTNKCETGWLKRFDSNVARLLTVGNSGRKFPEQRGSELEKFCSENDRLIKLLEKQRNDCMLDMPKQISGVLIYAGKNSLKQFCKPNSKQLTKLLGAAQCANSANNQINNSLFDGLKCVENKVHGVQQCSDDNIVTLMTIIRSVTGNTVDTRKCEKGWQKKQDEDVSKLITVGSSRKFPENRGADVKRFCESMRQLRQHAGKKVLHRID
ncbi:unnamed protein product [Medioppia subpectinata]|uniref:Uncharacterized protein n=1 Tax=Medioppia subpectinata TaxID=1979941 RepID=A0A7R9KMB2_9ACAR|nr:unnamed protein product [Medioppia subpectinata]CAG2106143.1 unnamed protein product [Medioppia subpectinata]